MSRIDELKKQHPNYALSAIDVFKMISPNQSNKYIEMLIKLTKDRQKESYSANDTYRAQIIEIMTGWGIDYNYLETFDLETLWILFNDANHLMPESLIKLFGKFSELNERKLIENNDVTSYSTWDEIEQAVSLAEMKLIDKETAKQIKKVYEDDTWLSLRPLSLEASMKYGANTKWCTTTESGQYYARYSMRGILIYNINKKTGYKVACFKNIDQAYDNEFSWWDVTDKKIEALDSEAPSAVLEAVRNEIKNFSVPNQILMTPEESNKLEAYKDGNKYRVEQLEEPRLHITGGFNWGTTTGTGTLTTGGSGGIINAINNSGYTVDYNPGTFTTTNTIYTSGNVGIGTINPPTQLQVNGDLEVRDGNIRMIDFNGAETMRITSNGETIVTAPDGRRYRNGLLEQPTEEDRRSEQRRLMTQAINEHDDRARDAQQRLDDAMAEQLAAANERVAEKHLSLLENIEMGTVEQQMIERMQKLAGIETREMRIKRTEAELEQLRTEIRREEEIAADIEAQREALKGDIHSSVYEAEQPVVHSQHNWINKIKSGYEKAKVYVTRSKMAKSTEQPV
jgi:hypothetical protein